MTSVNWTAYGAPAYRALAAAVVEAKGDDPLAPVTVLVPTNLCGVATRRHLAKGVGGRAGVAGLAVLTADRLAERLAAPELAGRSRRPATDAVLAAAWRRALARDAGVFAPVAEHPSTVRALVVAHRELREVDENGLRAIATGGTVAADLVRLHRTVVDHLAEGYFDVTDLRHAAAGLMAGAPDVGAVIIFLPQRLPAATLALLSTVAGLRIVAGVTGDERADATILASVRAITGDPQLVMPAMAAPTADVVRHASDADDEVRCVVRRVLTTLRTSPGHRVAVLYGAAQPYARLLAEHLQAAGLLHNGAGVRPTVERTLARLAIDVLALPDHDWRRDDVLSVIARATARTPSGRRLPTARWERVSREAGVVAGTDWTERLRAYAQRNPESEAAEGLAGFVERLRSHVDAGAGLTTWPALAEWAATAFDLVAGDLEKGPWIPEEEARAAEKIRRTLAGLAGLSTVEEAASVTALRGALELELADDLPRVGTFGRGVLVAPLSESIGLDLDTVFVVGLADDLVPGQLNTDPLLPEELRALADGQLPAPRERIDRQHRQLLAALAAAPYAEATFPRGDLRRSASRLPSRWLVPTLRALTGLATMDATRWQSAVDGVATVVGSPSYATGIATTDELATEQEWRTRAALAGSGALADDRVSVRALELVRARRSGRFTRYDGDLSGHDVPSPTDDTLTSPTALESWSGCPHRYFVERLLGVRPIETPEQIVTVSALDRGSIVHEALDEFHRTYGEVAPDQAWTAEHRAALHEIAREVAARYTARGVTGHPLLWTHSLLRILADLDLVLDRDNRLRAEFGRRQVRSELSFGFDDQPPVRLPLPGGRTVSFRGSADRVDRAGPSIVVVDYKTGSARSYERLSADNPTANGSRLQLPVYAMAARVALEAPDAPVSAEYWFVGADPKRVELPLTETVQAEFERAVDVIVSGIAAGYFPQRPPEDGFGTYIGCRYCDPDGLGTGEARRRWLRKRTDPRLASYVDLVEPV